jgi:hypothetical protein
MFQFDGFYHCKLVGIALRRLRAGSAYFDKMLFKINGLSSAVK